MNLMEEHRRITEFFEEQGIFSTLPGILMFMCQLNKDKLVNDETVDVAQQDKPCFLFLLVATTLLIKQLI